MNDDELAKQFQEQAEGKANRSYPKGRLNTQDEGALMARMAVDKKRKRVIIEYAKPVTWLAMSADDAVLLAKNLIELAKKISDEPIVMEL